MNLPIWRYKFHKTALKLELFELASNTQSLTSGALGSDDPTGQREETEEAATTARNMAKLTDGDFSGDEEGTSVTVTTPASIDLLTLSSSGP